MGIMTSSLLRVRILLTVNRSQNLDSEQDFENPLIWRGPQRLTQVTESSSLG